jgi:hypothetical protein
MEDAAEAEKKVADIKKKIKKMEDQTDRTLDEEKELLNLKASAEKAGQTTEMEKRRLAKAKAKSEMAAKVAEELG